MATAHAREPALLEPRGRGITAIAYGVGMLLLLGAGGACGYVTVRPVSEIGATGGGRTGAGIALALVAAFVACVGLSAILSARQDRRLTLRSGGRRRPRPRSARLRPSPISEIGRWSSVAGPPGP